MAKPFSQACENNKQFILDRIRAEYPAGSMVLEIGTCTAPADHGLPANNQLLLWVMS